MKFYNANDILNVNDIFFMLLSFISFILTAIFLNINYDTSNILRNWGVFMAIFSPLYLFYIININFYERRYKK